MIVKLEMLLKRKNNPESVFDFRNGHDRALKYLMGQVMKETKGKANPRLANDILLEELKG